MFYIILAVLPAQSGFAATHPVDCSVINNNITVIIRVGLLVAVSGAVSLIRLLASFR